MTYLKTKREQMGLNKKEMAELVEITLSTYVRIELTDLRNHRYCLLEQIANELNMSVDDLVIASLEYEERSDT